MLVPYTPPLRGKRRPSRRTGLPRLVQASFNAGTALLRLRFDRAIEVGSIQGNQILVDDAGSSAQWEAIGAATLIDPATVEIEMTEVQAMASPDTRLSASAGNGIVAAGDGTAWPGAAGVLLPFP